MNMCKCGFIFPKKKDILYQYIHILGKCPVCEVDLWDKENKPINRNGGN